MEDQEDLFDFTADKVKEVPTDQIVEGVITGEEIKKASEVFGENAKQPDQKVLVVHFETEYGEGTNTFNYYLPTKVKPVSHLGKAIKKYGSFKVGTKIKIQYDGEGYPHIIYK